MGVGMREKEKGGGKKLRSEEVLVDAVMINRG